MDGYYDPYPRFFLERTLVLVGHPGSGVAQVAHDLAGRTGLPHSEVDRWCEAEAGMVRGRIGRSEGLAGLRRREARALARALDRRPHGFVSVGAGCLLDDRVLEDALQRACVVFVRRPAAWLLGRIHSQALRVALGVPEFPDGPPASVEDVQAFLAQHAVVEAEAHVLLDGGERHPSRLAEDLRGSLDRLAGTVRASAAG